MASVRSGFTSLRLAQDADAGTLFGARKERFGGAVGVSLLAHALFILICYIMVTLPDPRPAAVVAERPVSRTELIWLAIPGPGGGGGGNRTPEPPKKLETRGPDKLSVPVLKPPPMTPPKQVTKPKVEEPPPLALNVPVRPMDVGQLPTAGAVEGSPAAPPASQGSGAGGGAGSGKGTGSGSGDGSGLGPGSGGGSGGGIYRIGSGILPPQLIREVNLTTPRTRCGRGSRARWNSRPSYALMGR
jgi:hypothetical protein